MALRDDRLKWNLRYRAGEHGSAPPEPHPLASRWSHLWSGGPMLDAACGLGRGIASAGRSFRPIYAVDISEVAIGRAREIWRDLPDVHWIVGDVAAMAWPKAHFGLICAFAFTDLPFFSRVPSLLRPGGIFLSVGFSPRQLEIKPALNPDWVARPEALRSIFAAGRVLECGESAEPPYRTSFAALAP